MGCGLSEFLDKFISETIKIMNQIDEIIDAQGG
jgi:hypothetical protein